MKNLLQKFFKKEPDFSYTIADYQPVKSSRSKIDVRVEEYQIDNAAETDDMSIDKIYQNS